MCLSIIVAISENGVIGRDGGLPWHLSADLRRFKRITMGHTIVMGRRTWESIGRPLPGRTSVVVSGRPDYRPADGVQVAADLESALELAADEEEVFVIGGAQLYAAALPRADRLYLTRVHAVVDGDVEFPPLDLDNWKLIEEARHPADDRNDHEHSFIIYDRA